MSIERFSLVGRTAIISGASRGIGRAVAMGLAQAGAEVTLCARASADLNDAAAEVGSYGKAKILELDVTDLRGFSESIEKHAPFDIFINSAGTNRPKPLSDVTEQDYDDVMTLNLKSAVFCAKYVSQHMVANNRRGSIISVSSQMGHVGAANRTIYCASKWALEGFTKSLALELAPHGIRVNTICPTFIETPMTKPMFENEEFRRQVMSKIKLGRIGRVEDVVGAAIYLASDASSLMTGSSILLDAGWTAD